MCKMTDPVGKVRDEATQEKKQDDIINGENRIIRELDTKLKGLKQIEARAKNKLHRRKIRWNSTKKEKKFLGKLKKKQEKIH